MRAARPTTPHGVNTTQLSGTASDHVGQATYNFDARPGSKTNRSAASGRPTRPTEDSEPRRGNIFLEKVRIKSVSRSCRAIAISVSWSPYEAPDSTASALAGKHLALLGLSRRTAVHVCPAGRGGRRARHDRFGSGNPGIPRSMAFSWAGRGGRNPERRGRVLLPGAPDRHRVDSSLAPLVHVRRIRRARGVRSDGPRWARQAHLRATTPSGLRSTRLCRGILVSQWACDEQHGGGVGGILRNSSPCSSVEVAGVGHRGGIRLGGGRLSHVPTGALPVRRDRGMDPRYGVGARRACCTFNRRRGQERA